MLSILVWLIVIIAALAIVWWILGQLPVPPPMRVVVNVAFGLIALLVLVWLVGSVVGPPAFHHSLDLIALPRLL